MIHPKWCVIYNITNQKKLICHLKSVSHTQYWWDLMDLWVYSKFLFIIAKLKSSLNTIPVITFIAIISSLCRYIPTSGRKCFQFLNFSFFSKILARSPWELQHQTSRCIFIYAIILIPMGTYKECVCFLLCARCWLKSAVGWSHTGHLYKDLTKTGNHTWKVSGNLFGRKSLTKVICQLERYMCKCFINAYKPFSSQKALLSLSACLWSMLLLWEILKCLYFK